MFDDMGNTIRHDELIESWRNKESIKKIKGSFDDNENNE